MTHPNNSEEVVVTGCDDCPCGYEIDRDPYPAYIECGAADIRAPWSGPVPERCPLRGGVITLRLREGV